MCMGTVDVTDAGQRLDVWLHPLLPALGLRARRRLVREGRVLVDGLPRLPLYRVRPGQKIQVLPEEYPSVHSTLLRQQIHLLGLSKDYAVLYKPAGLYTTALSGRTTASLERELEILWQKLYRIGPVPASLPPSPASSPLLQAALRLLPAPQGRFFPASASIPPLRFLRAKT